MEKYFKLSIVLSFFIVNVIANILNLHPKNDHTSSKQCELLSSYLKDVINKNDFIREGLVNVVIVDFSTQIPTSCVIMDLVKSDSRIVIHTLTSSFFLNNKMEIDYFIMIENFINNVSTYE